MQTRFKNTPSHLTASWLTMLWLCLFALPAHAASSLLIWPLAPTIESDQRASSMWLENLGSQPVTLQIRVLAWDQNEDRDRYQSQQQLIASPPFATIAPGARQMVRLTATHPVAPGTEHAYRILIDEIPALPPAGAPVTEPAQPADAAPAQAAGLTFQMRYSLPLFVYGEGLWGAARPARARLDTHHAQPQLSWTLLNVEGRSYLQLSNTGRGHARLSQVRILDANGESLEISGGLLGYVLPGKQMRWPLPEGMTLQPVTLQAKLGSKQSDLELPRD